MPKPLEPRGSRVTAPLPLHYCVGHVIQVYETVRSPNLTGEKCFNEEE